MEDYAIQKKVLMAVGGTGGHLFPAQTLAEELIKQSPNNRCFFAGAKLSASPFFEKGKFQFQEITSATVYGKNPWTLLNACLQLFKGFFTSLQLLRREKPNVVIGFGSFHSFPVLLAAYVLRTPIVLYESNLALGRVNQLFAKKARFVAVPIDLKKEPPCPLFRVHIKEKKTCDVTKIQTREYFGLDPSVPVILVFGGSQGAKQINNLVRSLIEEMQSTNQSFQMIHITGMHDDLQTMEQFYKQYGIRAYVTPFEKNMPYAYRCADFAICRSGAGTINELIEYELPAIVIPYPFAAEDHQRANGEYFAKHVGGGVCLGENNLQTTTLKRFVQLFLDEKKRTKAKNALTRYLVQQNKEPLTMLIQRMMSTEQKDN